MTDRLKIQTRLNEFYVNALDEAKSKFSDAMDVLSGPLLIEIPENYLNAKIRIMFVGKETNGWGKLGAFYGSSGAIEEARKRYKEQMGKRRWPGLFFPTLRRVEQALTGKKQPKEIIWNNLMKMDWDQKKGYSRNSIKYSEVLYNLSRNIFRFEVELLQPDVIIFACGYRYDKAIRDFFEGNYVTDKDAKFEKHAFWKFKIGHAVCYRTRHPNARQTGKFRPTAKYYSDIIDDIKNSYSEKLS